MAYQEEFLVYSADTRHRELSRIFFLLILQQNCMEAVFFINFATKLYGGSGASTYNIDKTLITK